MRSRFSISATILLQIVHNLSNFNLVEVVGRGGETQLQVGER